MLWKILRDRRLANLKFRRQVPLGRYIADFACFRHRLIVEADGPWHDPDEDRARDVWLSSQGFRVLRFSNGQISARAQEVIGAIVEAITPPAERHVDTLLLPSPPAGEGGPRSGSDGGSRHLSGLSRRRFAEG